MIRSNEDRFSAACRRCRQLLLTAVAAFMIAASPSVSPAAVVSRNVLKSFFQTGDKPTSAQFSALIDSAVNLIDDRYLLGLRTTGSPGAALLSEGVTIGGDPSQVFGPAEGLDDAWAGQAGFLGVSFTDNSETHYGYFQITAGVPGPTDVYPMFVEAFVYEDIAGTPITTHTVPTPEPSTLALAAVGSLGLFGALRCRRRRDATTK